MVMYKLAVGVGILIPALVGVYRFYHSYKKSKRRNNIHFHPSNEVVVIVGASSGIGKELALKYARRCKTLILVARRVELLSEIKVEIESSGYLAETFIYKLDITQTSDFKSFISFIEAKSRHVDTLVLNSGQLSTQLFQDYIASKQNNDKTYSDIDRLFSVNALSFIKLTGYMLPLLLNNNSLAPNLIVISSLAGLVGTPTRSLYSSTKYALHGFFESLRVELESKLQISLICLGTVDTDLRSKAIDLSSDNEEKVKGSEKNKLKVQDVVEFILDCSDSSIDFGCLPKPMKYLPLINWLFPEFIRYQAKKKYGI